MISQSNKNLRRAVQNYGCCFLNKLAIPQIITNHNLDSDQVNSLYDIALVESIVGKYCYVKNDNAAILLPKNFNMILNYPKVVRLGQSTGISPSLSSVTSKSTVMFIERHIVDGAREHFILYYANMSLAYNSKPGYMIVGTNNWYYYGIVL